MKVPNSSKMKRGKGAMQKMVVNEEDDDFKAGWRTGIIKRMKLKEKKNEIY